jgi:molybdopterin biosynthesis enzyme
VLFRSLVNSKDGLDMLITIGRSSVGVGDDVPEVLGSIDASQIIFHGVRLLPIRPAGLARLGRMPVCFLPGHCVSATLSFFLTAVPVLNMMGGSAFDSRPHTVRASLNTSLANDRPVGALLLVELKTSRGSFRAIPLPFGSNSLSNLARANGFLQIGPRTKLTKNSEVTVTLLGDSELP